MRKAAVALGVGIGMVLAGCGSGGGGTYNPGFDLGDVDLPAMGFSLAEGTFLLGRVAADAFIASEANGLADRDEACVDYGTRLLTFTDWDSSGDVSADDQFEVSYTNCNDPLFGGALNGGFTLRVLSVTEADAQGTRNAYFSVAFNGLRITYLGHDTWVSGRYQLDFSSTGETSDSVRITLPDNTFALTSSSGMDIGFASGGEFQYDSDYQAGTYRFKFYADTVASGNGRSFQLISDTLGNIPDELGEFAGHFGEFPTDGVARFFAPGVGSVCVLAPNSDDRHIGAGNPATVATRYSDGDEYCMLDDHTAVSRYWNDIVEGTLFADNDSFNLRGGGTPGPF